MNKTTLLSGWVLFLLMAAVAAYFWQQLDEQKRLAGALQNTIEATETQMGMLADNVASLETQIETAEQTIAGLQAKMENAEAEGGPEETDATAADSTPFGLTLGDMLDSLLSEEAQGDEDVLAGVNFMKEMFQGPQGEQMLEMGTRMALDMQFGDFFDMIAPEAVDAVKEILGDYMIHTARLGIGILGDGADMESSAAAIESTRETMLAELRGVLGEDGVSLYEEYERELPAKMMDQAMEMQLGMFARGLSAETRDLVRHTLVEELVATMPEETTTVPMPGAMQEGMMMQEEAYERALERLTSQLNEEEYGVVERFVRQQQQMTSAFGSMMGL